MGVVDGPTEVHKITIARQVLKDHRPAPDAWPTQFKPRQLTLARRRFDEILERRVPDDGTRQSFGDLLRDSTAPDELVKQMQEYLDVTTGNL
jgi:hypothetical protein